MIIGLYDDDDIIQEEEMPVDQPVETPAEEETTEEVTENESPDESVSSEDEAPVDTGDEPSNDDIESIEIVDDDDEMEESPEDNSGDTPTPPAETSDEAESMENIDSESKEIDNFADDLEKPAEPVPNNDVYFNGENPYQTQTPTPDQTITPISVSGAEPTVANTTQPTEAPASVGIDVTMTNFGTDTSPQQNQYDPKEINRLNDLIASENSAIGEYFQGSKETNIDVLRRLYSDIGEEERFHSEQLLFAKSQITGERYVPRDPDIKKEYEELLSMGMDEETAMATAADKVGLMSRNFTTSPEEAIHEMDQIIDQVNLVQEHLFYNHLVTTIMEHALSTSTENRDEAMNVFIESYIDNVYDIPTSVILEEGEMQLNNNNGSALKSAGGIISTIGRVLRNLIGLVVSFVKKTGKFTAAKARWLKNHKLSDLFKEGFDLYFYNIEKGGKAGFAFDEAAKYLVRLQYCCVMIAQQAGIQFQKPEYRYKALVQDNWRPSDIRAAMNDIKHVSLMKTKVTIDESNSEMFQETVFGVSRTMEKPSSDGVFVKLTYLLSDFTSLMNSVGKLINDFKNLANQTNQANLAHAKPAVYRELEGYLLIISKKSQAFANYISHDIGVFQKMNNTLNKAAEQDVQVNDESNPTNTAIQNNFNWDRIKNLVEGENIKQTVANLNSVQEADELLNTLKEAERDISAQLNSEQSGGETDD